MKALIVGVTGMAGTYMYQYLTNVRDIELYGTFRHSTANRNIIGNFSKATLLECDVNDIYSIEKVLDNVRPDIIFHFASYVSVYSSFTNPLHTFQTNIIGTANLMEAVRKIVPEVKILIPGSAEEYGKVPVDKMPIKEDCPLNPVSPYGISKKVQEEIGLYYFSTYRIKAYFSRTFHYTGPQQSLGFVCSDFAKQIVDCEQGKIRSIKVGNLDAKRDFSDIRDVVSAYWKILEKGQAGRVYNVCRGESIPIRDILNRLIELSEKEISVEVDPSKLRPSDVPNFVGDNTKLTDIGWRPEYTINESLADLIKWWRHSHSKDHKPSYSTALDE